MDLLLQREVDPDSCWPRRLQVTGTDTWCLLSPCYVVGARNRHDAYWFMSIIPGKLFPKCFGWHYYSCRVWEMEIQIAMDSTRENKKVWPGFVWLEDPISSLSIWELHTAVSTSRPVPTDRPTGGPRSSYCDAYLDMSYPLGIFAYMCSMLYKVDKYNDIGGA